MKWRELLKKHFTHLAQRSEELDQEDNFDIFTSKRKHKKAKTNTEYKLFISAENFGA